MKEYILTTPPASHDVAPPYIQRMMTWARASNEITGVIRGLLADGTVTDSEADYLRKWIGERPDLLRDPLVAALAARIERIFADGIVTQEELLEIKGVLEEFAPEDKTPTTLPLDNPMPVISIPHKSFCFTGIFVSGPRSWCQEQVTKRGGEAHNSVKVNTHYLVIGTKVSAAWVTESYGRKIQAAAEARDRGKKISIINEDHWLYYL